MIDIIIAILAVSCIIFSVIKFLKNRKKIWCSGCHMDCSKCCKYNDEIHL